MLVQRLFCKVFWSHFKSWLSMHLVFNLFLINSISKVESNTSISVLIARAKSSLMLLPEYSFKKSNFCCISSSIELALSDILLPWTFALGLFRLFGFSEMLLVFGEYTVDDGRRQVEQKERAVQGLFIFYVTWHLFDGMNIEIYFEMTFAYMTDRTEKLIEKKSKGFH